MGTFKIIKRNSNDFWHVFNNGAKSENISDFEVSLDDVSQTFVIILRNGANIPQIKLVVTDIVVIDETDANIEETFTNVVDLKNRLIELNYTPYINPNSASAITGLIQEGTNVTITGSGTLSDPYIISSIGGAVDSVNGQTGVVFLDADDISDTSTTKKFVTSAEKSTWNSKQDALGFTPENVSNKGNVLGNLTSTTIYAHAKGVVDYVVSLGYQTASQVSTLISTALTTFKTDNFLDATSSIQGQFDGKQSNAKLISANYTALNNDNLIVNATCTISDVASPINGTNYSLTIVNGIITIGGISYTQVGSKITRIYNSGSWRTFIDTELIDYSNISTIVGFASYTTKSIHILLKNGVGTCFYHIAGVSNSTIKSFTLDRNVLVSVFKLDVYIQNNSTIPSSCGRVIVNAGTNVADFRLNSSGSGFNNVNNAAIAGQFDFIY